MKHTQLLRTAALSGLVFVTSNMAMAKTGSKLLLQDLKAEGVEVHEASAISTAACNALSKFKAYDVLCGDDLRNMMRFGALAVSFDGCAEESCYSGAAKALDARFVVSGKVTRLGKTYVLALSMFDTKSGKPAGRADIKAESVERLYTDTPEAVSALLKKR